MNFPIPASRLSKTRVYGYLLVIRPVCYNAISQSGCAACQQRGLPSFGPFKKTCCIRDSVTTACVALPHHQTPPPFLPSHVLGTRIAQYGPSPLFTFHTHACTEHCRDLDLHMHTRLRWWLISLGGGGDITSIETER